MFAAMISATRRTTTLHLAFVRCWIVTNQSEPRPIARPYMNATRYEAVNC